MAWFGVPAASSRSTSISRAVSGSIRPGTAAVVILGDALAGHPSPLLYLVSLSIGALGVAGLVVEIHHYRQHHRRTKCTSSGAEAAREAAAVS